MNYSTEQQSELAVPFLAVPLEHAEQQEDPKKHDATDDDDASEEEDDCCFNHFINLALHVLLFVQFGVFFYVQDESVAGLPWSVVNCSIVLYMLTTYLYRECLDWAGTTNEVLVLLPEIFIVVTMGMCFFDHVVAAFMLLVVTKLFLALTVVVVNTYRLFRGDEEEEAGSSSTAGNDKAICDNV